MIKLGFLRMLGAITLAAAAPMPLQAQARTIELVNDSGRALGNLEIRRSGAGEWRPIGAAPTSGQARDLPVDGRDCAFDIRATPPSGEPIVWQGVNLCEVERVRLRIAAGKPFAAYR